MKAAGKGLCKGERPLGPKDGQAMGGHYVGLPGEIEEHS